MMVLPCLGECWGQPRSPQGKPGGETPDFGGLGMSVLAGSARAQASRPGAAGMLIIMFFAS